MPQAPIKYSIDGEEVTEQEAIEQLQRKMPPTVTVSAFKHGTQFRASVGRPPGHRLAADLIIDIPGGYGQRHPDQARAYARVLEAAAALHDAVS